MPPSLDRFDGSRTRKRQTKLIREYLGVTAIGDDTRALIRRTALDAAATKDEIADIINSVLEKLTRERFELPAFGTLSRDAQQARARVYRECFEGNTGLLADDAKAAIDKTMSTDASGGRSTWDAVKQEPKKPTVTNVNDFIHHLRWLQHFDRQLPQTVAILPGKRKRFVTEARALNVANMNELALTKRYALAALLIRSQTGKAFDALTEILIKIMQKLHNGASAALRQHRLDRADDVDTLVAVLRDLLAIHQSPGSKVQRLNAMDAVLADDGAAILDRCEAHMGFADNNYLPFLLPLYRGKRPVLFDCVASLELRSTTRDQTTLEALAFVVAHRRSHKPLLAVPDAPEIELSWIPEKWRKMVIVQNKCSGATHIDRRYFELCVFTQVDQELKSGDLFVVGSEQYADFRDQLVSWETYHDEVAAYGRLVGIETEPSCLVSALKVWLAAETSATDKAFPDNDQVRIEHGEPIIRKLSKRPDPKGLERIASALDEHLPQTNILDVLIDTEQWFGLSQGF